MVTKGITVEKPSSINAIGFEFTEGELFYTIKFLISDLDPNNNFITDSDVSENIGFFTNSIKNIEITNLVQDGNDITPENLTTYSEANLLVENSNSSIIYTLVDSKGLFLGISKADGSIVSTDNKSNSDVEVLSFSPDPNVLFSRQIDLGEIDLDLAVNSLDYIIEENLFTSLNSEILGSNGDDILTGGNGDDILTSGEGQDTLVGNAGADGILGENGNDLLQGKEGDDSLFGGNDRDEIFGDDGDDFVEGGNDDDTVSGGIGNDSLFGSPGNDLLSGGIGNDLINGDDDNDDISGGIGNDSLSGGNGNDTLTGGDNDDIVEGNSGNDLLIAGFGNDLLSGGADADVFKLGNPNNLGIATIFDFDRAENDKIEIMGNQSDYTFSSGSISGDDDLDTIIKYKGDTIAIAEDTITVDLNTDFVFL